jgi:hypothetical protein
VKCFDFSSSFAKFSVCMQNMSHSINSLWKWCTGLLTKNLYTLFISQINTNSIFSNDTHLYQTNGADLNIKTEPIRSETNQRYQTKTYIRKEVGGKTKGIINNTIFSTFLLKCKYFFPTKIVLNVTTPDSAGNDASGFLIQNSSTKKISWILIFW